MFEPCPAKDQTRPVLLHLPTPLLEQLDEAAKVLRLSRTRLILRSLNREVQTSLGDEVDRYRRTLTTEFASWPL